MEFTGKALNGYRILELVGFDGTSAIYKAAASNGEKVVAIKVFPSELSQNRQILERMQASFQALSRIKHPGIPPVMGFSVSEGFPYIVMPFMAAGSLEDRIAFGALAAINTEVVVRGAASALGKAHSQGLVHGNLNPSQILFDENGKVQIIGIGEESFLRVLFQREEAVEERSFDYRAPEVLNGSKMTPFADQYSLALIALQLLSHLPPDEALRGLEFHQENGRGYGTRPNHYSLALPSKVINVLSRALSTNPSDRFPSIIAMFKALEAAIWKEAPSSEPAKSGPVQEKASTEKRSNKRLFVFAIAILIVLCLFAIEPALTLQGDLKLGNLLSTIGMIKSNDTAEEVSIKMDTPESIHISTLGPNDEVGMAGDLEIQGTSETPMDGTEQAGDETPALQPTPNPSSASYTSTPTQIAGPTSTAVSTATPTEPQPTPTPSPPSSEPTIDPDRCSSYPGSDRYCTPTPTATRSSQWCSRDPQSDHYCTPTPVPTIDPDRCSSYPGSDRYCTPTPTATRSSQWCSSDPDSHHYCTPTPEPTIPPDQCSRHYHDDNFCTRTPEP